MKASGNGRTPKFFCRRKGISELVAVIVVLAITIAGATAVYTSSRFNFSVQRMAANQQYIQAVNRSGQLLNVVYHWEKVSGTQTAVKVYLYNYGTVPVTIGILLVNGRALSYSLSTLSGQGVGSVNPGVITLLSFTYPGLIPASGYDLFIYSTSGATFEWSL